MIPIVDPIPLYNISPPMKAKVLQAHMPSIVHLKRNNYALLFRHMEVPNRCVNKSASLLKGQRPVMTVEDLWPW